MGRPPLSLLNDPFVIQQAEQLLNVTVGGFNQSADVRQMNFGAKNATRRFLWLLHADSRVDSIAVTLLQEALVDPLPGVYYFDLAFRADGPRLMCLNAWGANLRSRYLGLPFGDQGLCLSRETFQKLGRFDETAPYGEDHLLIALTVEGTRHRGTSCERLGDGRTGRNR